MKIAVIGSGTMGNGIAHVFAQSGFSVTLIDISKEALDRGFKTISINLERMVVKGVINADDKHTILGRITLSTSMKESVSGCTMVIEAATENLDLKLKIFRDLDQACDPDTILATNTSSISITKIASVTKRQSKVIGLHFMNPVPVMKLVEVIRGYDTSDEVANFTLDLSKKIGKTPTEVNDYPGFIANRILMPMINEAIYSLYEGVAGVEEIDTVFKLGMVHPMGPLQLADFIGLDICHSIMKVMQDGFGNPKYSPCPLLTNMVTAGNLGKKTGVGFYDYRAGGKDLVIAQYFKKFVDVE